MSSCDRFDDEVFEQYFFGLKRNRQASSSAWALREEKVYLQMTRASGRLDHTADATEPDWDLLYERQQRRNRWNIWLPTRCGVRECGWLKRKRVGNGLVVHSGQKRNANARDGTTRQFST